MRIVVHIGLPKTGTSALQLALMQGREELLRAGICYPEAGTGGHSAHHQLAWTLQMKARVAPRHALYVKNMGRWSALKKEIRRSGAGTVLLSSEYFSTLPPAVLRKALESIGVGSCELVAYIRRQDRLVVSEYSEAAKCGVLAAGFGEIVRRYREDANTLRRYRYSEYFAVWAGVFGSENIRLRVYDRCPLEAGGIVGDFGRWLGISGLEEYEVAAGGDGINVSPGPKTLAAVMRLRTRLPRDLSQWEFAAYDAYFVRKVAQSLGWNRQRFQPWSAIERADFLNLFLEDTVKLEGCYGLVGGSVFPEVGMEATQADVSLDLLCDADWEELVLGLQEEYGQLKKRREYAISQSPGNVELREKWGNEQRALNRIRGAVIELMGGGR